MIVDDEPSVSRIHLVSFSAHVVLEISPQRPRDQQVEGARAILVSAKAKPSHFFQIVIYELNNFYLKRERKMLMVTPSEFIRPLSEISDTAVSQ